MRNCCLIVIEFFFFLNRINTLVEFELLCCCPTYTWIWRSQLIKGVPLAMWCLSHSHLLLRSSLIHTWITSASLLNFTCTIFLMVKLWLCLTLVNNIKWHLFILSLTAFPMMLKINSFHFGYRFSVYVRVVAVRCGTLLQPIYWWKIFLQQVQLAVPWCRVTEVASLFC